MWDMCVNLEQHSACMIIYLYFNELYKLTPTDEMGDSFHNVFMYVEGGLEGRPEGNNKPNGA